MHDKERRATPEFLEKMETPLGKKGSDFEHHDSCFKRSDDLEDEKHIHFTIRGRKTNDPEDEEPK